MLLIVPSSATKFEEKDLRSSLNMSRSSFISGSEYKSSLISSISSSIFQSGSSKKNSISSDSGIVILARLEINIHIFFDINLSTNFVSVVMAYVFLPDFARSIFAFDLLLSCLTVALSPHACTYMI